MLVRKFAAGVGFSLAIAGSAPQVSAQLVDSLWTIRGGRYAGATVVIDRRAAMRKSSRFWRPSSRRGDARIVGWNPSRLPAPVAFRQRGQISESDSIAFWSILQQMESDIGMRLFEPASVAADEDPSGVIIVDTRSTPSDDGVTLITWSSSGAPYDARVYLRSPGTLHNTRVVTHEMMHALGFGHTSAWTSVMSADPSGPARLTAEDVAYAQAAFASREESERSDMWERLALAVEREPDVARPRDGYGTCPIFEPNPDGDDGIITLTGMAAPGVVTAIGGCKPDAKKGPDTIAMPAAAVDTTADRPLR